MPSTTKCLYSSLITLLCLTFNTISETQALEIKRKKTDSYRNCLSQWNSLEERTMLLQTKRIDQCEESYGHILSRIIQETYNLSECQTQIGQLLLYRRQDEIEQSNYTDAGSRRKRQIPGTSSPLCILPLQRGIDFLSLVQASCEDNVKQMGYKVKKLDVLWSQLPLSSVQSSTKKKFNFFGSSSVPNGRGSSYFTTEDEIGMSDYGSNISDESYIADVIDSLLGLGRGSSRRMARVVRSSMTGGSRTSSSAFGELRHKSRSLPSSSKVKQKTKVFRNSKMTDILGKFGFNPKPEMDCSLYEGLWDQMYEPFQYMDAAVRIFSGMCLAKGNGLPLLVNGDHSYYFYNDTNNKKTWFEAYDWCHKNGMELISIEDTVENQWVSTLLSSFFGSNDGPNFFIWTGGNNLGQVGVNIWSGTGKPLGFTDFKSGEPDNSGRCFDKTKQGGEIKWNDRDCSAWTGVFICEREDPC